MSKMKGALALVWMALLTGSTCWAQDDLMDFFGDDASPTVVTSAFKAGRIINVQSPETSGEGEMNFIIAHRFGRLSDGWYDLFGLDNAQMRMGLDYGITDRIQVGVARSTFGKTLEGNVKWRFLEQMKGGGSPVSLTGYSVAMRDGLRLPPDGPERRGVHRMSYVHQLVVTRKWSPEFSLAVIPSLVHRNLVDQPDRPNDVSTMGVGFRYKLNRRMSVNGEYHYLLPRPIEDGLHNSLSLGLDIETGGHVFQLHVTNSRGMFERAFLAETPGRWQDGDLYFGFNINRVFQVRETR
ncbi:DUF5777 family beta-barrel protein [Flavobacteriales bacterium]|nr:DUF5777 family beta-barrel protein [Flavobacteriales bacterium]